MKYNPEWSFQEAFEHHDPDGGASEPFSQWLGHRTLLDLHKQYIGGDKSALLFALRECARCNLLMPEWVADAYIFAFDEVNINFKKSWDDVFGVPHPKGTHLNSAKKKWNIGPRVYLEVNRIKEDSPETPIDAVLFERVGKKFHVGKTEAEKLYYCWKDKIKSSPPEEVKMLLDHAKNDSRKK